MSRATNASEAAPVETLSPRSATDGSGESTCLFALGGFGSCQCVETDNAYVKADMVPLSTDVAGMVQEVLVHQDQAVVAAQPLLRIDPQPFQIAVNKAPAHLGLVRIELLALQASHRAERARRGWAIVCAAAGFQRLAQADKVTNSKTKGRAKTSTKGSMVSLHG